MINIGTFGTKRTNNTTTRISTGGSAGGIGSLFNPVYLWGQYFDDSGDINGDMEVKGDVDVEGTVTAYEVQADKMTVDKIAADELEVNHFSAETANISDLVATNLKADKAELLNALIEELSATNLVTENLTVTKGAHFFELIIDKIKAAGGSVLFTPADGFKIDKVVKDLANDEITLYFRATDGDKKKANMWKKNDQARCQNFNKAELGVNYDVDSKYFWTLVKNTNNELNNGDPVEVNLGTEEEPDMQKCHYIIISTKAGEFQGLVNPEIGDDIVMLGHCGEDVDRQAAIYIAAYSSIDGELKAPLFVQYAGINDFDLDKHKFTWFSAGLTGKGEVNGRKANTISGDVRIGGQSIEDYIDDKTGNIKSYRFMPYTNTININKNGDIAPSNVTVKIIYNNSGNIQTLDNVPIGMKVDVYGVTEDGTETLVNTIAADNPISIASSSVRTYQYIYFVLKSNTNENIIYDRCQITIVVETSAEVHGGHWEFAYKLGNTKPTKPAERTSIEHLANGWTKDMPTPNSENKYVYMSQCFVSGTGVYGTWSDPLQLNGADGKTGEDGRDIEFVYCRTNTDAQIQAPSSNNKKDWPNYDGNPNIDYEMSNGNVWYDNPQGVEQNLRFEWISMRTVKGDTFSDYSTPAIWSVWGSKGMDGDGYEYIYRALTSSTFSGTHPKDITEAASDSIGQNKSQDEFVPKGWHDEPQEITSEKKYCYVSTRKKHSGTWGDFTNPVLWTQYAVSGEGGYYALMFKNADENNPGTPAASVHLDDLPYNGWAKTPTTPNKGEFTWMSQRYVFNGEYQGYWTYPIRITGDDGENGKDGTDINFIYKRTKTNEAPGAPAYSGSTESDYQTIHDYTGTSNSGWMSSPKGVDDEYKFEWVATRTKIDGAWGRYTVALWSNWGETGMDGDGVQYIFYLSATNSAPDNPAPDDWSTNNTYQNGSKPSNKTGEYIPDGWTDDPGGVSASKPYQYVSMRRGHKGAWGEYSDPKLWSIYASSSSGNDGSNGNDGQNAKIDRLIDNGCYANLTYDHTKNGDNRYKIDFYINVLVFHAEGADVFQVTSSTSPKSGDFSVKWEWDKAANYADKGTLSTPSSTDPWEKSKATINYSTDVTHNNYKSFLKIKLYSKNNALLDILIIPVKMKSEAIFEVIQGEIPSITSTVTGSIQPQIDTISNSVSQIQQTADAISSTVTTMQNDLNDISNNYVSTSTLNQTATNITAEVSDGLSKSGIDVSAHKIVLNSGNTEINGDLNIHSTNVGLSVWNGSKAAQIRNAKLGAINNYSFAGYKHTSKQGTRINKNTGETYTLTTEISLGSITSSQTLEITGGYLNMCSSFENKPYEIVTSGSNRTVKKIKSKAILKNSGNTNRAESSWYTENTPEALTRAYWRGLGLATISYTTQTQETLYLRYEIEITFQGEGISAQYFDYDIDVNYYQTSEGLNYMAPDGCVFSQSEKEYTWIGNCKVGSGRSTNDWAFVVRNKQQNFLISPLGIFRTKGDRYSSDSDYTHLFTQNDNYEKWGDISTTALVYHFSGDINLSTANQDGIRYIDKYGIFICTASSGWKTVTLPDPSTCVGRMIFFKCTGNGAIRIKCSAGTNSKIMDGSGNGRPDENDGHEIGRTSTWYICDGNYWICHFSN